MNIDPSTPRLSASAPLQQADHQSIPQAPPNSPNALGLRMQPDGAAPDAFSLQAQHGLQQQLFAAVPSSTQAQHWAPTPVQSFRYTPAAQAAAQAAPQPIGAGETATKTACTSKKRKVDDICETAFASEGEVSFDKKSRT